APYARVLRLRAVRGGSVVEQRLQCAGEQRAADTPADEARREPGEVREQRPDGVAARLEQTGGGDAVAAGEPVGEGAGGYLGEDAGDAPDHEQRRNARAGQTAAGEQQRVQREQRHRLGEERADQDLADQSAGGPGKLVSIESTERHGPEG